MEVPILRNWREWHSVAAAGEKWIKPAVVKMRINIPFGLLILMIAVGLYLWPTAAANGIIAFYATIAGVCVIMSTIARFRPQYIIKSTQKLRRLLGRREVPGMPANVALLAVLVGSALGTVIYFTQILSAQDQLLHRYNSANVIQRILREAPFYPIDNPSTIDTLAFVTLLERLSLLDADTTPEEIFGQDSKFKTILPLFFEGYRGQEQSPGCGASGKGLIDLTTPTLEVIARLAQAQGCSQNGKGTDQSVPRMANVLARRHGSWDSASSAFANKPELDRVWFVRNAPVSDRTLLHGLYKFVDAYEHNSTLKASLGDYLQLLPTLPKETLPAEHRALVEFQLALLGELHRDPDITAAKGKLDVWLGYEQFAIVVLAFVLASLLLVRWLYTIPNFTAAWYIYSRLDEYRPDAKDDPAIRLQKLESIQKRMNDRFSYLKNGQARQSTIPPRSVAPLWILDGAVDDLKEWVNHKVRTDLRGARIRDQLQALTDSRAGLNFAYNALPALGFLGTVHGILAALGTSWSITSTDRLEQAAGISLVSSSLGLAFSTTLIALSASLLLGFFDMLLHRMERLSVVELGRKLHVEFLS